MNAELSKINFAGTGMTEVEIQAETIFGARNGLETVCQLIEMYKNNNNEKNNYVILTNLEIKNDKPKFPYRGLMLDTSRHFIPKDMIHRQLDAMAASKLNSFHWHITDTHSFPLHLNTFPKMSSFGAYSESDIYTINDVIEIISYAKRRGIRTIFEIDMPSHSGNGWQTFNLTGPIVVCLNEQPWREYCIQPPCGQLNPLNEYIHVNCLNFLKFSLAIMQYSHFHYRQYLFTSSMKSYKH